MKRISYLFIMLVIASAGCEEDNLYNDNMVDPSNPDSKALIINYEMNVDGQVYTGVIGGNDINISVPYGTVIGSYSPVIEVSPGASITPASGALVDFTAPVVYTVTSKDSSVVNQYNILISITPNNEAKITGLTMNIDSIDYTGFISGTAITVTAPYGTVIGSYSPVIQISSGATVSPESGSEQDFSSGPVTYTVIAHDGVTNGKYQVSVIEGPNPSALITGLSMNIGGTDYTGNISGLNITIEVPFGTPVGSHSPLIQLSPGATVSPQSGSLQDFSSGSLTYTVTAQDGVSTNDYLVTINELPFDTVVHGDYTISIQSDVDALLNKETIDGSLTINSNFLTDMNGLESLTTINGSLLVQNTSSLHDLEGLGNLNYIDGSVDIRNNANLMLFENLQYITYIGNNIIIYNNPLLDATASWDVTSISGGVSVSYNDNLKSVNFLNDLTSCASLYVSENGSMTRIGMGLLTAISGSLQIINNDSMNDIGLINLDTVGGDFEITYNDVLPHARAQSILDALTTLGGDSFILHNLDD